jgi:hypothetical protein
MIISYGILHLFLRIFGGKAKFEETIRFGLSISIFPTLIGVLFSFIPQNFIDMQRNNFAIPNMIVFGFIGILALGVIIWNLIVSVFVYSKLHKISKGKALLAMILPLIIILGVILIIFIITFLTIGQFSLFV